MVYTKQQKRSMRNRTKFGSGRSQSHREDERREERNLQKDVKKAVANVNPAKTSLIAKIRKRFTRNR